MIIIISNYTTFVLFFYLLFYLLFIKYKITSIIKIKSQFVLSELFSFLPQTRQHQL